MADNKKDDQKKEDPKNQDKAVKDLKELGTAVADAKTDANKSKDKAEEKAAASEAAGSETKADAMLNDTSTDEQPERVQTLDEHGRAYGTGRRKDAIARVWLKPGTGKVIVNGKDQAIYFARQTQRLVLNQPFLITKRVGQYDVMCTVKGGGLSGQAGAVRHGISRALENFDPELRPSLKQAGMLTRDSRIVERKKVGRHKARRNKQWAKR